MYACGVVTFLSRNGFICVSTCVVLLLFFFLVEGAPVSLFISSLKEFSWLGFSRLFHDGPCDHFRGILGISAEMYFLLLIERLLSVSAVD